MAASKILKGPKSPYRRLEGEAGRRGARRALLLEDLRVRPGLRSSCARRRRTTAGRSTSATIAAIWRGGCIIRARFLQKITEAYRRDSGLVNLMLDPYFKKALADRQTHGARWWRSRRGTGIPRPPSAARSPTSTAIAPRACPPICSRRSGTTSAPTPTSAWTRRAGSSSTWTGRTRSARSIPSDRPRVTAPLTFGTNRFGFPDPARVWPKTCREAEAAGFSHLWFPDSQLRTGDVFINLLTAARGTERAKVGTLLVNPVTRHPTVLASSIATVDLYAPGRVLLGFGAGDTSVFQVGLRPARLAEQERRRCERFGASWPAIAFRWAGRRRRALQHPRPVPVIVAGSGPKTLRMAGRAAGGVSHPHRRRPRAGPVGVRRVLRGRAGGGPRSRLAVGGRPLPHRHHRRRGAGRGAGPRDGGRLLRR